MKPTVGLSSLPMRGSGRAHVVGLHVEADQDCFGARGDALVAVVGDDPLGISLGDPYSGGDPLGVPVVGLEDLATG